jgi:hypothetical protein
VQNAIDYQSDDLNYEFAVYSDAGLSNKVADVPAVAQGETITSWTLDTDLDDNNHFWWICRAYDASTNGPWMPAASFYVNHVNNPPLQVVLSGPPAASILHDSSYTLNWHPTTDPDAGGHVRYYHIQISTTDSFSHPVVDDATLQINEGPTGTQWIIAMPLSAFNGSSTLQDNTTYFWRVRACDQWTDWSQWSSAKLWFIYGTPPPTINSSVVLSGNDMHLCWDRSGKEVVVEFSPSLTATNWQEVVAPTTSTNASINISGSRRHGFYRIRTVD